MRQPTGGAPPVVDLHAHSTESDGVLPPAELVAHAAAAGVAVFALTDHDTMTGIPEARKAAACHGMEFVPGVEISCRHGSESVHLLGLFVDPEDRPLVEMFQRVSTERRTQLRRSCVRLRELGLDITFEEVAAVSSGASLGRPHIADVLVRKGVVKDRNEAFDRYLAHGRPGYASYGKKITVADAAQAIHAAGGISSLAHPKYLDQENVIPILRDGGIRAIEVFHADHSAAERRRYLDIAESLGLFVSGGSDFHAPEKRGKLGSDLPYVHYEELRRAAAGTGASRSAERRPPFREV